MPNNSGIKFKGYVDDPNTAYIQFPGFCNATHRTVRIEELIENYVGPMINLDFDPSGRLVGIEILIFSSTED